MSEGLDKFGEFITVHLRDNALLDAEVLLEGKAKAPGLQVLQDALSGLGENEKEVVRQMVEHSVTTGLHDFLFAIQEESENEGRIRVTVDGEDVAALSDGIHGEIFGDDGWMARYSEFPPPQTP